MNRVYDYLSPVTFAQSMRRIQRIGETAAEISKKPVKESIVRLQNTSNWELEETYSLNGLRDGFWEYGPIADYFLSLSPSKYVNVIRDYAIWVLQYSELRRNDSEVEAKDIIVASRILATDTQVLAEQFKQHRKIYK